MLRSILKYTASCLILVFLTIVCSSQIKAKEEKKDNGELRTRGLRIALVPEKNIFEQRRRYRSIADHLSKKLDMLVRIEIMPTYADISNAISDGSADAGFFGSFSYILTRARTGIEPIVRPVWTDGSSTYRSYIFVRKDSGIRNIQDMKGKSLSLVDKATTAGYIFQLYYFKSYGINNMEDYFSKVFFAGSHDAAAWAVYTKEADVGGCKNHIYKALGEEYPDFREQMITLIESPEVPSNGLAVSNKLNPALKLRLKGLLLNLHENKEGKEILKKFGAEKFIETTDNDYRMLYRMIDTLNIDLENYGTAD